MQHRTKELLIFSHFSIRSSFYANVWTSLNCISFLRLLYVVMQSFFNIFSFKCVCTMLKVFPTELHHFLPLAFCVVEKKTVKRLKCCSSYTMFPSIPAYMHATVNMAWKTAGLDGFMCKHLYIHVYVACICSVCSGWLARLLLKSFSQSRGDFMENKSKQNPWRIFGFWPEKKSYTIFARVGIGTCNGIRCKNVSKHSGSLKTICTSKIDWMSLVCKVSPPTWTQPH